jgi:hypothetical protein
MIWMVHTLFSMIFVFKQNKFNNNTLIILAITVVYQEIDMYRSTDW